MMSGMFLPGAPEGDIMTDPESSDTEQLLQQAQAGNREAFERLVAGHRAYLRELISLRMDPKLRPRVDPSDIVQETQLDIAGCPGTWRSSRYFSLVAQADRS